MRRGKEDQEGEIEERGRLVRGSKKRREKGEGKEERKVRKKA